MVYSLLQLVLWKILQVFFVCWLLNVVVVFTCLKHIFPAFDLQGIHWISFKSFLTLPCSIQCIPNIRIFLFHLNAVLGSFLKISLKFSFVCKIFQFFLIVLIIIGRNQLYIITRGILSDFFRVSFSAIRSILLSRLILSRFPLINNGSYPCFTRLFFISLRLLFKSTWFELICLIRIAWL